MSKEGVENTLSENSSEGLVDTDTLLLKEGEVLALFDEQALMDSLADALTRELGDSEPLLQALPEGEALRWGESLLRTLPESKGLLV